MDSFRLLEREPAVLTWQRVRDGELLATANTGCAALLWPGDAVLGRLTPTEDRQLFESAPLPVPDRVAECVAGEPASWLDALADWGEYADAVPLTRPTEHDGLLVELPPRIWKNVVCDQPDTCILRPVTPTALASAAVDLGRFLLEEFEAPDFRHLDTWACLAAALVDPDVVYELSEHTSADDRDVLGRLTLVLAEPAATICRNLATGDLPQME